MSTILAHLYKLLAKNTKWHWSEEQETAFIQAKTALTHDSLLTHFDPSKRIFLFCDASPYGVGAILAHMDNACEKPVAYASRTLTRAEKNYSQTEREALSLVFGVTRFRSYLLGTQFTLVTDHKPLTSIFSEMKSVPQTASSRLQRWALTLAAYNYNIAYRPGSRHANVDALSRCPLPCNAEDPPEPAEMVLLMDHLNDSIITATRLARETEEDSVLSAVKQYVSEGWPGDIEPALKPYWRKRDELSIHNGLICWNRRAVVPSSARGAVLSELHHSHFGTTLLKRNARAYVWWPGLDADIENTVKSCSQCQRNASNPVAESVSWPEPEGPWSRVHLDYFGPTDGHMVLVVVDPYTKWIDAVPVRHATTSATVDELRCLFARYGLPTCIVTDNGPQFTSEEFERFVHLNNIKHVTSPPYHPNSNGHAERAVRTIKDALQKLRHGSLKSRIAHILFDHHSTPSGAHETAPFDKMLKFKAKCRLDMIFAPEVERKVEEDVKLKEGTNVWMTNYSAGCSDKWVEGVIMRQIGNAAFSVRANGKLHKRHADQLRVRIERRDRSAERDSWLAAAKFDGGGASEDCAIGIPLPRRSNRLRNPPVRLGYDSQTQLYS